jgi:hypothetical protein
MDWKADILGEIAKVLGGGTAGVFGGMWAERKAAKSDAVKELQVLKGEYREFADTMKNEVKQLRVELTAHVLSFFGKVTAQQVLSGPCSRWKRYGLRCNGVSGQTPNPLTNDPPDHHRHRHCHRTVGIGDSLPSLRGCGMEWAQVQRPLQPLEAFK